MRLCSLVLRQKGMSSADPLGFFAGEASSSSEDEEDEGSVPALDEPGEASGDGRADKLPSPDTLFATVGRPSFLDNPQEGHIDWDRFVKTHDTSPEPNTHGREGYAAIPPPKPDDWSKPDSSSVSAAPVRYDAPSESTDPKRLTVSSDSDATTKVGTKRPHNDKEEAEVLSKRKKEESFRQKEKRKRDLGQSSRGKSYVEEEKRILRQGYGLDER